MILVGVWANRNWILGNWIKEVRLRHPKTFRLWWLPSIYAGKRFIEKIIVFPIPTARAYFFSYPTIFRFYLEKYPQKFSNNSLVLYPHNEPEMGNLKEQVRLLNQSYKVYFYCKQDSENLLSLGLDQNKIVIANCAVDNDCILDDKVIRDQKTIVLASKFGPRKGAALLPDILQRLQDWNFILMGRGWDEFLMQNKLLRLSNLDYVKFNKPNRAKFFSKAKIFLSLSKLEGGPVPLIESMSLGVIPISTNTGFAPEFIRDGVNGFLLPIYPSAELVESRIRTVDDLTENPEVSVSHLTWDRIARITLTDLMSIRNNTILKTN
jgi:glycosyltransferase involved in cell wall biosynthesis